MSNANSEPMRKAVVQQDELKKAHRLLLIQQELAAIDLPPMLQGKMASAIQELKTVENAIRRRAR